jgi:hypothetical protein
MTDDLPQEIDYANFLRIVQCLPRSDQIALIRRIRGLRRSFMWRKPHPARSTADSREVIRRADSLVSFRSDIAGRLLKELVDAGKIAKHNGS